MAAQIKADFINPFLVASTSVLQNICFVEAKLGKPYIKDTAFTDNEFLIMVGVTGDMKGQVILCFPNEVALDIASKMCMMQLPALDEIAQSAVSELCNMILGNAATVFSTKGIVIDITPPTRCMGNVNFSNPDTTNICIPIIYEENKQIEINVAIRGD